MGKSSDDKEICRQGQQIYQNKIGMMNHDIAPYAFTAPESFQKTKRISNQRGMILKILKMLDILIK